MAVVRSVFLMVIGDSAVACASSQLQNSLFNSLGSLDLRRSSILLT